MKNILLLASLLASAATVRAEDTAAPIELPPYTCVGRIVNANHLNVAVLDDSALIRIYKQDGTLLARSAIRTVDDTPYNYRLVIPMASASTANAAAPGEKLDAKVTYAGKDYVTEGMTPNLRPGVLNVHDVTLFEDTNGNAVADEYETYILDLASALGIATGTEYTPHGDYDGDGVTNYEEYIAGTNPLSSDDRFGITDLQLLDAGENKLVLKFLTARAKTYQLYAVDSLTENATWKETSFREAEDGTTSTTYHTNEAHPDPVEKVIYIPKNDEQKSSHFFRIRVK